MFEAGKRCCYIARMRIDATTYAKASDRAIELAREKKSAFFCISNTHVVTEAYKNTRYRNIINSAELVTPDGVPLVWCMRLFGIRQAERVCGPDLLLEICRKAQTQKIAVGFYGGKEAVRRLMVQKIKKQFPQIQINYSYSPPFWRLSESEDKKIGQDIIDSGIGILFVGLGCPKQELWAGAHLGALPCVMVTVGAAFDYIAGALKRAPKTAQIMGLEWLTRLIQNPHRLWQRYFLRNSLFIYLALKELFSVFFLGKKNYTA